MPFNANVCGSLQRHDQAGHTHRACSQSPFPTQTMNHGRSTVRLMTTKIHPALCTPCSALILALLATLAPQASTFAQGTAFTYQGRLLDTGSPANGNYDMRFYLRDALSAGNPVGATNTVAPVAVSNGLFRSEEHTSELQSLRHLVC